MMLPLILVIAMMLVVRIKKYLNEREGTEEESLLMERIGEVELPAAGEVLDFLTKSRTVDERTQIWSGYSSCAEGECAADAAFRAVQQQVAIPGWLH